MTEVIHNVIENNIEYQILPYQFFLLTFWGIWCPKNGSEQIRNTINLIFIFVYSLDTFLCTEMLIYFVISFGTPKFKLINFFLVTNNITAVYKAIKLMKNRNILKPFITNNFSHQWINFKDPEEYKIYHRINIKIKLVFAQEVRNALK